MNKERQNNTEEVQGVAGEGKEFGSQIRIRKIS